MYPFSSVSMRLFLTFRLFRGTLLVLPPAAAVLAFDVLPPAAGAAGREENSSSSSSISMPIIASIAALSSARCAEDDGSLGGSSCSSFTSPSFAVALFRPLAIVFFPPVAGLADAEEESVGSCLVSGSVSANFLLFVDFVASCDV